MRISEGTLAFGAGHAVEATLEGHHSVTAWVGSDRVQESADVRITMSGADAAARLAQQAAPHTYATGGVASVARRHAVQRRSASHAVHVPAVAPGQLSAGLSAHASTVSSGGPTLSAADVLWLALVQIAGSKEAAADLANRLAQFAAQAQPASGIADTLQAVADAHPMGQASQGAQPSPPPEADWGYREDASMVITETERTSFAAGGSVTTADGRQITIAAAFELARSTQTGESVSVRAGAALHDPLVLNTGIGAPMVVSGMQAVDVNNDGTAEQVAALAPGSAYLVRDLNGNGVVDGGNELFGPATDNGFGELGALDTDHNGWVDESDAAWSQLGLWTGESGAAIQALGSAGVGAIATGSVATPFSFGAAGQLAAAGVYLHEDGQAGVVGEINLYA